jgi:DNA helicase-2/ATP-dependent DNA helicase PcrA
MTRRIDKPDTTADIELHQCLDEKKCFVMIAGAGSGKTTSLVKALDYLGKIQGEILKKRGQRIACITYTTVAEHEILDDVGHDPLFHISTIHSFLWEIIKPFQMEIKIWVSQRIKDKINELEEQKRNFSERHKQSTKDKNQKDILRYEELRDKIEDVSHFRYQTGSNYLEGILGHDDVIKIAPFLIKERPLLRIIFAQKYPFLFIDESQDTILEVVDAVKTIALHQKNNFCLGFFGDEMQKIYLTGIGKISVEEGWKKINKPENFRCPTSVLQIINNIRRPVDGIEQIGGKTEKINGEKKLTEGTAKIYLIPSSIDRDNALLKIREHVSEFNNDTLWISDEKNADVKLLVIEHRMAANRLGFSDLYSAFKDGAPKSLSEDFTEGKTWALRPFQSYILPLVEAFNANKAFEVLELLRQNCPLLQRENLQSVSSHTELLQSLKDAVQRLAILMAKTSPVTVRDVLKFTQDNNLIKLDNRLLDRLQGNIPLNLSNNDREEETDTLEKTIFTYFDCPAVQVWGYQTYINDESPYSTQHSIKGAEFERVLVVLDDEEGKRSTLYSYDKLFGLKPPSDTDQKNIAEGKETVFDRTRRLLYVCCSRTVKDLVIAFFVTDVNIAIAEITAAKIFKENDIINFTSL